ncbi:MAG: type II secretion system F family protein [Pirellulales bacterium]
MHFQYRVRDPLGNIHQGAIEAAGPDEAEEQLAHDGFQVVEVVEEDGADSAGLFGRVGKSDVIYLTAQLAIMVDTGITLSTALESIAEQEENLALRRILTDLKNSVEGGEDFSSALGRYPKLFGQTYVSLVKASEATGSLGEMLDRIATYLRKELETRNKVRAALAYPTVMMVLAIAVTIFLLTYVLPKFTPLFNRKGIPLPKPTIVMMTLSEVLLGYWYLWVAGALAAAIGFVLGKRTEPGRQAWDWVKINLPILGPMLRKVTISRSIRTLGTMLTSGVPMLDSLQLSAAVAGNYYYERLWRHVSEQVTSGNRIREALQKNSLFPSTLVQMISSGEETGKLGQVLVRISNYYDQEVETSLKSTISLIEPLMITCMGFVVGGIALALMLPIFSLSRTPG